MKFSDWGTIPYDEAWQMQESIFNSILDAKKRGKPTAALEQIIFCYHPHVYTLGKTGNENNLLVNKRFLEEKKVSFFRIDRGGDITYHGPGQIVGYPILDLENHRLSLKEYVSKLEESVIELLREYGIVSSRLDGATGVWLDAQGDKARKVCAIGVKASRFVTMHGFALNVNTDLQFFDFINPCGFTTKGVTSIQKELGREISMPEIKDKLRIYLTKNLSFRK